MGNLDRLEILKEYAKEEPENPFNWYALAIEYLSVDPNEAEKYFIKLLSSFEAYLPTYYTAASFFSEREELEKAKETFEKGITLAQEKQEIKTLQELKNAYQNFLFENDLD
ncbi:tetratricopeptide repeat protein [Algoriphagus lutimaris]|uniref:tetratricopeptide repeat protein n=1 Tax=Algoriphagus lutimaris TaxID=613197 RepID=UPI00196AA2E6|nr:tetratricopeptide repeat protein [Algoriphagus lutimaris]MBN3519012.1 tetratricopeptide repeat protein [Algoriphagus lutimaris]